MTTLKVVFMALVLFLLTAVPQDSEHGVAQSADVPTLVRGG